jgi:hypothetical protein
MSPPSISTLTLGGCIVAVILVVVAVFTLGGCANTYANCRQTVTATDAAVITTTTLRASNVISASDAKPISIAAHTLYSAETAWKAALDAGDKDAAATASSSATAALATLSAQLQQSKQLSLHPAQGRAMLKISPPTSASAAPGKQTVGEIDIAVAVLQLVADLEPTFVNWINAATANVTVTSADVQQSLDVLQRDIAALDAAIAQ